MNDKNREKLSVALAEALAMEVRTIEILENRADRIRNHPGVVERFKKHIKETSWQIAQLETMLKQLGEETRVPGGALAEIGALLASDDIVRSSIANSAFERFEMAAYARIAAIAEKAGEHEIARIAGTILRQEEVMAQWLEEHLPNTPLVYLMFDEIHVPVISEDDPGPRAAAGPLN
jgi:ferritin-like metal-binding protein YciE